MSKTYFNTPCEKISVCENGQRAQDLRPGDFILVHSNDFEAIMVRFGQALRFKGKDKPYAYWNHAALYIGNGDIIEASPSGVAQRSLGTYDPKNYVCVYIQASDDDRMQAVRYGQTAIMQHYGWLTIVSIGLSLLSGLKFSFGFDDQQICSGLVAGALERTWAIFNRNASNIAPADLAKYYSIGTPPPPTPVVPVPTS